MWSLLTVGRRIVIVLVIAAVLVMATVWTIAVAWVIIAAQEIVLEPVIDTVPIITTVPIMPTPLKKKIVICGPSVGVISTVHRCQLSTQNTVSVVVCR